MDAPTVANEFLELVVKSELLSADQVRRAAEKLEITATVTAESAARRFVRNRLLTPFQAERLLEGRYRGFVIYGYRVREVLGVGGMGCVYIAEDRDKNRKVALKVLSSQHALDAGMLTRMKLEAFAGMHIKHPNVIETYRISSTGAVHYMVMELVRGISLHELVALSGPVKWQMACDMFLQVAEGLHAAHRRGIIHRDIKPANILIDAQGVTKLLDFGLAKIAAKEGEEFSLAMIFGHDCLGTPDYIAPEQAVDSNSVGPTADIYSLGCTFYVALTGRVPFPEKTNAAKIEAQKKKIARPIRDIRPNVPAEVAAIAAKMMAKDPAERYSSAAAVIRELRPFAERREVKFDFRELVTIRAKQAREKDAARKRGSAVRPPRSSITSAAAWIDNSSHHLQAEIDTCASEDTPAIRQPAPPKRQSGSHVTAQQSTVHQDRVAIQTRGNVPSGWFVRLLKTRQKYDITRVKTRIGTAEECEIRLQDSVADSRQCYIEYAGSRWNLRTESLSQPTFVNGHPETFVELRHGSKVTFTDGSGFELLSEGEIARERKFRRNLLLLLLAGFLTGTAVIAALLLF
ncbi:MAG: protein kinase [Planctomycetaceae bacterium]|nr:protein kinase [Planctomycetaceae bacterium]